MIIHWEDLCMLTKAKYKQFLRNSVINKYSYNQLSEDEQNQKLMEHVATDGDVAIVLNKDMDITPDYRNYSTILYDEDGNVLLNSKDLYSILPELSMQDFNK